MATATQREITFNLAAGQLQNVPVNRPEFVYIKTAARPVIVTVEGQAIAMEAGEKPGHPAIAGGPGRGSGRL